MLHDANANVPSGWKTTFAEARTALCRDDLATARPLFDTVTAAAPENTEVLLYAEWTRARLGQVGHERVEALARSALRTGQALALPLCILGHAALNRGDLRVAVNLFRRAAQADPALLDARRGLRLAEGRLSKRASTINASAPIVIAIIVAVLTVAAALGRYVPAGFRGSIT